MVQRVAGELGLPVRYVSTDEPTPRGMDWISQHSMCQRNYERIVRRKDAVEEARDAAW